ncbi:MAG: nitrogenase cofactor biosynthesis protein NifB [Magnetococcales bacterium]|nr:nitrogenase cofactor biosynthesis protein NifB [Magnetococcales bacterium]
MDDESSPDATRRPSAAHPCYSREAHGRHARLHLPVAPACNIQCHYCHRQFDCANESRPGVVSRLLTPEQALDRVLQVRRKIPQLSVVGFAGPGDPLANPERLFATCRMVRQACPELQLCLSTNGLLLPRYADTLAELGVGHVTITLNAVDPTIGARIHPWVFWKHRRLRGREAAAALLENQLLGLERLVADGVLVKINSVLIPGINDRHLADVHWVITERGALLHNILPLISRPEHGTCFGLTGQREPTAAELEAVRRACAQGAELMTHCRQCRADAVGLLDQDRAAEFVPLTAPPTLTRHALPPRRVVPDSIVLDPIMRNLPWPCPLPGPAPAAPPASPCVPMRPS